MEQTSKTPPRPKSRFSWLLRLAAVCAVLTLIAIPLYDKPLAKFIHGFGWDEARFFSNATTWLDLITGKSGSKFQLGSILVVLGGFLLIAARTRSHGFAILFIGLVQFLSTLMTGMAKIPFGRLRPYELLASGNWRNAWFEGGNSFPSGHVGFYFGLFLPLVFLYPRWRWPLLAVPFFMAIARIITNDHFLSDVTASITMTTTLTLAVGALMKQPLEKYGVISPQDRKNPGQSGLQVSTSEA